MAKVGVWVKWLGDGQSPETAWRLNLPGLELSGLGILQVKYTADCADFADFTHYQQAPFTKYAYVRIDSSDLPKVQTVDEADVPENDKLIERMTRECRGDYNGKSETFFDSISDIANANGARKKIIADVLKQAKARGLSKEKADKIRDKHKLPKENKQWPK